MFARGALILGLAGAAFVTALPASAETGPVMACSEKQWCLGILSNGDVYVGDPRPGPGFFHKVRRQDGGNLPDANGKASPRQWALACSEAGWCLALDSDGGFFAGSDRPGAGEFIRRRK